MAALGLPSSPPRPSGPSGPGPPGARRCSRSRAGPRPPRPPAPQGQGQAKTPPPAGKLTEAAYPTNPTDAIAIVNGQPITRQRLADECVARKGQEILETLIARTLIEQALAAKKLEVTAAEIDEEIDRIAMQTAQLDREKWLEVLYKERGISPAQYARDIIYPGLALRKLAGPKVQITEKDLKEAFEANHGARLRCRIIMTDTMVKATQIWEELRKNPDSFDKVAKLKSMDTSTRALGGMLPEPIARFANPKAVSKAAFEQLVNGDARDTNPAHKPKDGDITGPIQVNENAWLIMKREELIPGPAGKFEDPRIRGRLEAQVFEVKLNEAMEDAFREIHEASTIDNKLTGFVRKATRSRTPSSAPGSTRTSSGRARRARPRPSCRPPAGIMARPGRSSPAR